MSEFDKYLDEGYLLKSKLLDNNFCEEIIDYIESIKATINIPFSDVGWGFGNMVDDKKMIKITSHEYIFKF